MMGEILNRLKVRRLNNKWRQLNAHNQTKILKITNLDLVRVGTGSYGVLDIYSYGHPQEGLIVGNYVSIARGVKFLLGGQHQMATLTSFPLYSKLIQLDPFRDARTNGKIIVEDEVWIGMGATILSGVRIGKGAIVGAGSVVTKDVEPYSIVGGNPAMLIKMRFSSVVIEKLSSFNLGAIDEEVIKRNIENFYEPITESNVDDILKMSN